MQIRPVVRQVLIAPIIDEAERLVVLADLQIDQLQLGYTTDEVLQYIVPSSTSSDRDGKQCSVMNCLQGHTKLRWTILPFR